MPKKNNHRDTEDTEVAQRNSLRMRLFVQSQYYSHYANNLQGGSSAMRKMGRYCKAYPIQRFQEFSGWKENAENVRKETKQVDGKETEVVREFTDADYLYLQEDFTVTDGIFLEE